MATASQAIELSSRDDEVAQPATQEASDEAGSDAESEQSDGDDARKRGMRRRRLKVLKNTETELSVEIHGCDEGVLNTAIFSDTHSHSEKLEWSERAKGAAIVICCGDWRPGSLIALRSFSESLPHALFAFVPGNHDDWKTLSETDPSAWENKMNVVVLIGKSLVVNGVRIYGFPWHPAVHYNQTGDVVNSEAFQLSTSALADKFKTSAPPADTHVIVTHGPPYQRLDATGGQSVGCENLKQWIDDQSPALSVFGHVHSRQMDSKGQLKRWQRGDGTAGDDAAPTLFVNAAMLSGCNPAGASMAKGHKNAANEKEDWLKPQRPHGAVVPKQETVGPRYYNAKPVVVRVEISTDDKAKATVLEC